MANQIILLAAGKGTRMKADHPKVLAELAGKPLLHHLLESVENIVDKPPIIICGYKAEELKENINPLYQVVWKNQEEQLGTAHAVMIALDELDVDDTVIVAAGDVPLTSYTTFEKLVKECEKKQMAIVTQHLKDPSGYGRIKRNKSGEIAEIVEHKDANTEELEITEINTGIMAFPAGFLIKAIPEIKNNNAQNEYYLTDIIKIAQSHEVKVKSVAAEYDFETKGVNSKQQLAELEREYQEFLAKKFMEEDGVQINDPSRIDFRGETSFGKNVKLDNNIIFEGKNKIGSNVSIASNCYIKNAVIEDDVLVEPFCHIENAVLKKEANIGPYARIRPDSVIGEAAKIGNFVEVKKSVLGNKSKANHLAYIGDSAIGNNVNIGAGTITCNYDGVNKHETKIEDDVFVGSNTSLVAPVNIKAGATIGAGSTIAKDVPAKKLSIARAKQVIIENWKRPEKK